MFGGLAAHIVMGHPQRLTVQSMTSQTTGPVGKGQSPTAHNTLSLSTSTFPASPSGTSSHLPSLLRSLVSACSCCPSCRSFQPTSSVINHRGSQLQWGWSGQTSLSLCQQGMPGITRHTTLIDAAPAHTPHFRQSARAGINSLLLDSMWRWGWGARRGRGEEIPFYDLLI